MKRLIILLSILFSMSTLTIAKAGEHYWLIDAGMLWNDKSEKPDGSVLAGLSYGYGFNANWAVEFDYKQTVSGGEYSHTITPVNAVDKESGEFSVWILSSNIAYRHLLMDSLYMKGKLGFNFGEEERTSNISSREKKTDISSFNAALGAGFLAGDVIGSSLTVELEFAIHQEDLMSFMLGANATF